MIPIEMHATRYKNNLVLQAINFDKVQHMNHSLRAIYILSSAAVCSSSVRKMKNFGKNVTTLLLLLLLKNEEEDVLCP